MSEPESNDSTPAPVQVNRPEPTLKIVVGGKEFDGHEEVLRVASPYFEAMLGSQMREQATKTIEFPDRSPDEWEVVAKFFLPKSHPESKEAQITKDNVRFLIPWFHEFCLENLLVECDDVLEDIARNIEMGILSNNTFQYYNSPPMTIVQSPLKGVQDLTEISILCGTYGRLPKTKAITLEKLQSIYKASFLKRCRKKDVLEFCKRLVPFLEMEAYREALWPGIASRYLTEEVQQMDFNVLIQDGLFVHLLAAEVYGFGQQH